MKTHRVSYWITTILLCGFMVFSAVLYLGHAPAMMKAFAHLGYPSYFPTLLGVAKLLGVIALFSPGLCVIKEWAYAGFAITFISAFISHSVMGDGLMAAAPLVALAFLVVSYVTRPADRRIPRTLIERSQSRSTTLSPLSAVRPVKRPA
ncbi:MAG TPA: DoxX family protein [Candidatus Saccharimonadales bacterium]|nr:DoxX family protein [Candidatus Saccharimonadales bacterium]